MLNFEEEDEVDAGSGVRGDDDCEKRGVGVRKDGVSEKERFRVRGDDVSEKVNPARLRGDDLTNKPGVSRTNDLHTLLQSITVTMTKHSPHDNTATTTTEYHEHVHVCNDRINDEYVLELSLRTSVPQLSNDNAQEALNELAHLMRQQTGGMSISWWVLDGGASTHFLVDPRIVKEVHRDKYRMVQPAIGPAVKSPLVNGYTQHANDFTLELDEVVFNDRLVHSLLSERRLLLNGWRISEDKKFLYPPQGCVEGEIRRSIPIVWGEDGLFWVKFHFTPDESGLQGSGSEGTQPDTWGESAHAVHTDHANLSLLEHKRLAHIPHQPDCKECDTG